MRKLCGILIITAWMATLEAQTTPAPQPTHVDAVGISNPRIYPALVLRDIPDLTTPSGDTQIIGNRTLAGSTTIVPAQPGARFGFRSSVTGAPGGVSQLSFVNRFPDPGITGNNTHETRHIEEFSEYRAVGQDRDTGDRFDYNYALVRGQWTFEIWYGAQKLAVQNFDVVAP